MKKLLLSISVVILFFFYSNYKQNGSHLLASSTSSTSTPLPPRVPNIPNRHYKDGSYTGDVVDVFYGNVQVQVFIQNGKINDVKFLQSPTDRLTSIEINLQAMPILTSEAIQAQSTSVDGVSGATATSQGFVSSLGSALAKAK